MVGCRTARNQLALDTCLAPRCSFVEKSQPFSTTSAVVIREPGSKIRLPVGKKERAKGSPNERNSRMLMASLGERLRAWREAESMPRAELAAMLGVTAVTVWNWERGIRQPRPKYRTAIVHLIGQSAGPLANPSLRSAARKARRKVTKPVQTVGTAMREAKERIALLAGVTPSDVSISIRC